MATETIQTFHPVSEAPLPRGTRWTMRLMRIHFVLAGLLLFLVPAGAFIYLYSLKIERLDLGLSLRIRHPGDIYQQKIQVQFAGVVLSGVLSLIPLRAVRLLDQRRRSGLFFARLAALMLMTGYAVSAALFWLVSRKTSAENSGLFQDLIQQAAWVVRIVAFLIFAQSTLGLWYFVASFRGKIRGLFRPESPASSRSLRRLQRAGIGLWAVVMVGLGATLGVLTDWLYEIPVHRPQPGALLYATSFDDLNDEWDRYPGSDSAQIMFEAADPAVSPLAGGRLVITHGSPNQDEVIWSTLDRKFNDMDLRVTTLLLDGPVDQNQFGVIFRYRDKKNFYSFRISGDGYYMLSKVKNGVQEVLSDWGPSDAIRQGNAANEIRVLARGNEFRFFINGQPVQLCLKGRNKYSMWDTSQGAGVCFAGGELTTVYRDSAFKQGRVALTAGTLDGSKIAVAFDDLVIVGPEPQAMAQAIQK